MAPVTRTTVLPAAGSKSAVTPGSKAIKRRPALATRFQEGDRVSERGRAGYDVAHPGSPNFHLVSQFRHHPREGRVVSLFTQLDRMGRRCTYANVLWDGRMTPSVHMAARLKHVVPAEQSKAVPSP